MIIDCDCGVDDAQAIMLALAQPNVQILAITCVAGNTNLDNVCVNVLKVLEQCQRTDIPVFKGASVPLLGEWVLFAGWDYFRIVSPNWPLHLITVPSGWGPLVCLTPKEMRNLTDPWGNPEKCAVTPEENTKIPWRKSFFLLLRPWRIPGVWERQPL